MLKAVRKLFRRSKSPAPPEASTPLERYCRHAKKIFRPERLSSGPRKVLVCAFNDPLSVHAYAHLANALADRLDAGIAAVSFIDYRTPELDGLFESFGAAPALNLDLEAEVREQAWRDADRTLELIDGDAGTLLALKRHGVTIGDLVHDTYMRRYYRVSVDFADEGLRATLRNAFVIADLTELYLRRHDTAALITNHLIFQFNGIPTRLAIQRGVPAFFPCLEPMGLIRLRLSPETENGSFEGWPGVHHPYFDFKQMFEELSDEEQTLGLRLAKEELEGRLSGTPDPRVLPAGISAYGTSSGSRLLASTGRPRMIVLLNDFCDGPQGFRWCLFRNFVEWITFTLREARRTPFDWYLKPHPWLLSASPEQSKLNQEVMDWLRKEFPEMRFLDSHHSNRQILDEGVTAAFTIHGTVGHEFAYLGLPVVNAGDNYHIAFNFNKHPRSIDEYRQCIHEADRLDLHISKDEILAFYYMMFVRPGRRAGPRFHLAPELRARPDYFDLRASPRFFDHLVETDTPKQFQLIQERWQRELDLDRV
jgi:hypothetical protein